MSFCDSYNEFCDDIKKLKGRDCYKVDNLQSASPLDKLSHFIYCKCEGLDCDFDLAFLHNEKLQTRLEDAITLRKEDELYFSYLNRSLCTFEDCFEAQPKPNRWSLFLNNDVKDSELQNQLKEKDALITKLQGQLKEKDDLILELQKQIDDLKVKQTEADGEWQEGSLERLMRGILNV